MARTIDRAHAAFTETFFKVIFVVKSLTDKWVFLCLQSITSGGGYPLVQHQVDFAVLLHRGL